MDKYAHTMSDAPRTPLPTTSSGTHSEAFGTTEWGLLTAIALIWGSSFLFMAIGLEAFAPGVITLARVGLGAATLALIPRARGHIDRADMGRVALLGVIWIGVPLTIFPIAQQWIDSSVAGMLNGAMPVTSTLWAIALLGRVPAWRQIVGIAAGFIGMVLISLPEVVDSSATALGAALVILAVVLYGLSTNVAVPLQQKYGALPVLFRAQLVAIIVVLPYGLIGLPDSTWSWSAAAAMVPLGALGTGLAFVLMATLVGRAGATRGSIAIYFVPVVALVLGVVFLDEPVEPLAVGGLALVLVGAWFASRREA